MKIEMYMDSGGEWRWRLRTPNGRIVADSSEGYASRAGVRRSIANFVKYLAQAVPVEEIIVRAKAKDVTDVRAKIKVDRPRAQGRKAA